MSCLTNIRQWCFNNFNIFKYWVRERTEDIGKKPSCMSYFQYELRDNERWKVGRTDNNALRLSWKVWIWSKDQYSKGLL